MADDKKPAEKEKAAEVSPGDRRAVDSVLATRRDEEVRLLVPVVATLPTDKGGKTLRRVCAFLRRSFVIIRESKGKVELVCHYTDLVELHVGAADVSIKTRAGLIKLGIRDRDQQQLVVTTLVRFFLRVFPAVVVPEAPVQSQPFWMTKFAEIPRDMMDAARADYAAVVAGEGGPAPLGGFLRCYLSMCEWLQLKPVGEICWDAENLMPRSPNSDELDTRLFRREFIKIEDLRPILNALSFNEHFHSLTLVGWSLPRELAAGIAHMLRFNSTLTRVVFASCGLNRDCAATLCDALVANAHPSLTHLDLSGNPFEDKGFATFGSCFAQIKHKLQFLSFANCSAGKIGVASLVDAIANNETLALSLVSFDISGNNCSGEATTAITKLLSRGKITLLSAQGTALTTDTLQSCYPKSLLSLDISGNQMARSDVARRLGCFLNNTRELETLRISNCAISLEILSVLWSPDSHLSLLTELDISDNELGDDGLLLVLGSLKGNAKLKKLNISRCWGKKTTSRPKLIAELVSLSESNTPITSLEMAGGKYPMRNELLQFLFSLMNNKTIQHLDISGHQIGDPLAVVMARVAQTNTTLASLRWDRNMVTAIGFEYLRIGLAKNTTLTNLAMPLVDIAHEVSRLESLPVQLEVFLDSCKALGRGSVKPKEPQTPAQVPEMARHSKLRHLRPAGVDTMTACQLFTQLGEFVRTEGEAELLAGIPQQQQQQPQQPAVAGTSASAFTPVAAAPAEAPIAPQP